MPPHSTGTTTRLYALFVCHISRPFAFSLLHFLVKHAVRSAKAIIQAT